MPIRATVATRSTLVLLTITVGTAASAASLRRSRAAFTATTKSPTARIVAGNIEPRRQKNLFVSYTPDLSSPDKVSLSTSPETSAAGSRNVYNQS